MKLLRGMDAMFLYSETPNVHTHTLKIGVLDVSHFGGKFTFELFRQLLWLRLHLLEPLRYRLVEMPLRLHHPVWMENAEVDLDYHVRRVRVAGPGTRRELDLVIDQIASTPLDRHRPLWVMYFVEGLADNSVAVVVKIHHAVADGVASANLLARAMHFTATAEDERDPAPVGAAPETRQLLAAACGARVRQFARLPRLIRQTAEGIWRLRQATKRRSRHPELAGRFSPAPTFFNHKLSPGRRYASTTLALADVKQTGKQAGITINDLVLTVAAGALRELLLRYDGRADRPLIASVPTSLSTDPDRVCGNEVGALNVSLPVQVDDPLQRVKLTSLGTAIAKEDTNLLGPALIASWMEYLPPAIAPALFRWLANRTTRSKLQNLTISNVPGPKERGHVGGTMLREFYSIGPLLPGSAMNITVWSYVDQLNISVLTDDATLRDPHEVTDAMIHAFIEIRRAVGISGALTTVDSAMGAAEAIA